MREINRPLKPSISNDMSEIKRTAVNAEELQTCNALNRTPIREGSAPFLMMTINKLKHSNKENETPVSFRYSLTDVDPSSYKKPFYDKSASNHRSPLVKMNNIQESSAQKTDAQTELQGLRKFLAEIQACNQPPSSTKSEATIRHLNGVSPTRYRQNHIYSTVNLKESNLNVSEEPQVSCFHEDTRDKSEPRCVKNLQQQEEESQPLKASFPDNSSERFSQNRQEIISRNSYQMGERMSYQIGERISHRMQERLSQRSTERTFQVENNLNVLPNRSKTPSISECGRSIPCDRISSLTNTLQHANNMIRALERQLELKDLKIRKIQENSEINDQQIQHYKALYEAELEKSRVVAGKFKTETFKLTQEISDLKNKLSKKQYEVEKYTSFMAKLQNMNNKLLKRVKTAEKQTQIVASKDKVIKKLEEMERQLIETNENKLLNSLVESSLTPKMNRIQPKGILTEVDISLQKTDSKSAVNNKILEENKIHNFQGDSKAIMEGLMARYQKVNNPEH